MERQVVNDHKVRQLDRVFYHHYFVTSTVAVFAAALSLLLYF